MEKSENSDDQGQSASSYFSAMFEQVAELAKDNDHSKALKVVRERNQLLSEQKKKIEEQEAYLKFQTAEADSISTRNRHITQVALRLFWRIDDDDTGLITVMRVIPCEFNDNDPCYISAFAEIEDCPISQSFEAGRYWS